MPRVVHFEIGADEPQRAVKFYSDCFGWTMQKWEAPEDYWLMHTGPDKEPGINGEIMKRMNSFSTINTIDVPNLDEALARVAKAGGKAITEKQTIPGVGIFAYCQDTEGNLFGVIQGERPMP